MDARRRGGAAPGRAGVCVASQRKRTASARLVLESTAPSSSPQLLQGFGVEHREAHPTKVLYSISRYLPRVHRQHRHMW